MSFELIFDDVILEQLKKLGKNAAMRDRLSAMLDKIEELGPNAGRLIDSKLSIYEIKSKRPPIRLYFKHSKDSDKISVFEYELKTSGDKQKKTISKIKKKVRGLFRNLNLFV